MSGDDVAAWKRQQALERQSTSRVETVAVAQQPISGGDVCVWDAFGAFWCEKNAKRDQGGYVQNVAQRGQALVYEGFCGCGADAM